MDIEVLNGDEGWPLVEALDRECYPAEVMATVIWRDVTWAHADLRVLARMDGHVVSHAGIYLRKASLGDAPVAIGGIGGVMTSPRARRKRCASAVMTEAASIMKHQGCDFGLLFCETHNLPFYERLSWRVIANDTFCEQPQGHTKFDLMHAMVLPLGTPPGKGDIDLCGLPW